MTPLLTGADELVAIIYLGTDVQCLPRFRHRRLLSWSPPGDGGHPTSEDDPDAGAVVTRLESRR
jgi:hypothetical protein